MLRFTSISSKVVMVMLIIIVVITFPAVMVIKQSLQDTLLESLTDKGTLIAKSLSTASVDALLLNDRKQLQKHVAAEISASRELDYVVIQEATGDVVVHSFTEGVPLSLLLESKMPMGEAVGINRIKIENEEVYDFAAPILVDNQPVGIVRVGLSPLYMRQEITRLLDTAIATMMGIALIGMVITALVLKQIIKPLRKLRAATTEISSTGNLDYQINISSNDEIQELAQSFNHMLTTIRNKNHQLEESQKYNRWLFKNTPIGLALCRMNGDLVDINQAYADIVGRSIDEVLHLSYWDITPPEYTEEEKRQLEALHSQGRYGPYEKEYVHKNGSKVPVRLHGRLLEMQGERYIWSSVEDVTEERQMQEQLKNAYAEMEQKVEVRTAELSRANQQLQELDKLKSMFIASMSHELRTPLNSIIGFSGMMLQGLSGELTAEQKDNLERVNRSGKHLLELITDVIDISKIEAGRIDIYPEDFNPLEIVDAAVETILPQANKKHLPILIKADEMPEMHTDRRRLYQCLLNYLSNAVKYSERGEIVVEVKQNNDMIDLSVKDNGLGIADEDMPKLFEAFERLDTHLKVKAGGSGLGLYLTRKIVTDLLGGEVYVNSVLNVGSVFGMRIPRILKTSGTKNGV